MDLRRQRQPRPMLGAKRPRIVIRAAGKGIAESVLVAHLPRAIPLRVVEMGLQALVLEDGFVLGVVLVLDVDGDPGLAGRFEEVGVVGVGVVVADGVVGAEGLVHGPGARGAVAGGAVQGVACGSVYGWWVWGAGDDGYWWIVEAVSL